jgi:hypothetical protein
MAAASTVRMTGAARRAPTSVAVAGVAGATVELANVHDATAVFKRSGCRAGRRL